MVGIDTAAETTSVALANGSALLGERTVPSQHRGSAALLPLLQDLMASCSTSSTAIAGYAVTTGPGSFTGVRIGVATAKGLAFLQDLPCAGVSTLQSLANTVSVPEGTICCAMDARRGQVYVAWFSHTKKRLVKDTAQPLQALPNELRNAPAPIWLLGNAASLLLPLCAPHADCRIPNPTQAHSIAYGAILAARPADYAPAAELLPRYLRGM